MKQGGKYAIEYLCKIQMNFIPLSEMAITPIKFKQGHVIFHQKLSKETRLTLFNTDLSESFRVVHSAQNRIYFLFKINESVESREN